MNLLSEIKEFLLGKPTTELSQKNNFTSANYRGDPGDDSAYWNPLRGYGGYDSIDSINKYRSYAYAAIKKRAENLAKADCYVYKEFKNKKNEEPQHPFLKLLRTANIYGETFKETLFLTSVMLDLFGNVYWHVLYTDTVFGRIITEIRCLLSANVTPVMNAQNTLVEYYRAGNIKFSLEEIIHFRYPNPFRKQFGYAPVDAFNFTLDIEYFQGRFSKSMFGNNANFEGIIKVPGNMNDPQREKLQSDFESRYTKGNVGKTPVFTNGMDYIKVQGSPREMDFRESRLQIRDEIFVILDVPKTVMNVTDDVNYSNSQSAMRSFIENTLQPFAALCIEAPINSYFRKVYGDRFLFSMEYEFKTDRQMQLNTLDLYLKYNLIKKEVLAEQEGYSTDDVPDQTDSLTKNLDNAAAAEQP